MKIRSGFVSNSSSSSYIIAYKMGEECEYCGRSDVGLTEFFDRYKRGDYDDTYIIAEGIEAVVNNLKEDFETEVSYLDMYDEKNRGYKEELLASLMSDISKISRTNDAGYEVVWLNVSYSDSDLFNKIVGNIDHKILARRG